MTKQEQRRHKKVSLSTKDFESKEILEGFESIRNALEADQQGVGCQGLTAKQLARYACVPCCVGENSLKPYPTATVLPLTCRRGLSQAGACTRTQAGSLVFTPVFFLLAALYTNGCSLTVSVVRFMEEELGGRKNAPMTKLPHSIFSLHHSSKQSLKVLL